MDRFDSMSVLIKIVELGSLSAAARQLNMPLATVSRKLAELEALLKTRLLVRSTRQLTLTDAGRAYVAASKRILEQVEQAERAAAGEYSAPKGDLVITAPVLFGRVHVLPVITDFLAAYPDVDVRLVLADRTVNLLEEHIDAAVRIGELPDSGLIASRIGTIRRVSCASPRYLAEHGEPGHPDELKQHACITFDGLQSPTDWTFGPSKVARSVPVHSRLIVNSAEAAIDAAVRGAGITRVLSYQAAEQFENGSLQPVLGEFEPAPWPVNLLYGGQGLLPLKLRAFIDFAVPRLRERI